MWITVFAITIAVSIGCVVMAIVIEFSRVSGGCFHIHGIIESVGQRVSKPFKGRLSWRPVMARC